ncbi:DsbC family protein [Novosphingobium sp. 9U]|uniref:DsbC family protein n=1 Tax=Novosphingobium sp. 9U TaxID=2653158 RepID=UPI0012F201B3|nr:DsbC family protein [Novosphingobium sp. 9U]VWX49828.1 Thiol:disulfide interchange protein [Novosphingobium sp. 9U]
MKVHHKIVAGLGLVGLAGAVGAYAQAPASDAQVLELLKARLPKTQVAKVDCSRIGTLCEVQAGSQLFYTDRSARYLVIGRVYDMEMRQDLTAARLLEINPEMLIGGAAAGDKAEAANAAPETADPVQAGRGLKKAGAQKVSLEGLPKNGAVEWGSGGPKVTVFSDFRCGYCKALHEALRTMNVRVIERPISVLGTRMISNAVVCAPDRRKALADAYEGRDLPAGRQCDTSGLDANEKFAHANGFDGTPVIVRADGAVLQGFRPTAFLETWLKGAGS